MLLSLGLLTSCDLFSEKITLVIEGKSLQLEVAITDDERNKGLSNRPFLGAEKGMIFIFPKPDNVCFWMKDTYIALDAIFINRKGRVTQIAKMEPASIKKHCSKTPVRFVVEVNQGWAEKNGITTRTTLDNLEMQKLETIINNQNL